MPNLEEIKKNALKNLNNAKLYQYKGTVSKLLGLTVEAKLPNLKIGDLCYIETADGTKKPAEVVSFKGEFAQLLLLYDGTGISQGSLVETTGKPIMFPMGDFLLGRLVNPLGEATDGRPMDVSNAQWRHVEGLAPDAFTRPMIKEMFSTGLRAIDGVLTLGCGQRMGLFAGSGARHDGKKF